jgi:hypothetical protein
MSLISTVHQTKVLTNILLNKNQQDLAKFSKYRQVENYDDLDTKPMAVVAKYKGSNLEEVEEDFLENINEMTENYKGRHITFSDLKLVNQVCQGLLDHETSNITPQSKGHVSSGNENNDHDSNGNENSIPCDPKLEDKKEDSLLLSETAKPYGPSMADKYNDHISSIEFESFNIDAFEIMKNGNRYLYKFRQFK